MDDQLQEAGTETELKEPAPEAAKTEEVATLPAEEVSKSESEKLALMTVGDSDPRPNQNTVIASVEMVSPPSAGRHQPSGRVYVKIKYPSGWKKAKHFKDGDIKETSPESAKQFVAAGFATIVENVDKTA